MMPGRAATACRNIQEGDAFLVFSFDPKNPIPCSVQAALPGGDIMRGGS